MDETVYFADLTNTNGAMRHSGDEQEGDEDLGQGDDEIIYLNLAQIPTKVIAMIIIGTVATEGRKFSDIKSATMRMRNLATGEEICRFDPVRSRAHTIHRPPPIRSPSPPPCTSLLTTYRFARARWARTQR